MEEEEDGDGEELSEGGRRRGQRCLNYLTGPVRRNSLGSGHSQVLSLSSDHGDTFATIPVT